MKIILTGATGMVGAEVLREAIADTGIEQITILVRKPSDIKHPKINTIIHQNFLDYTNLSDIFKTHDACIWCLGISQMQVSKEEYNVITYDYTVAAAKQMLEANPFISFLFTSGEGADNTEKSRTIFARVKGKAENTLMKLGFKKLYIVRPGAIKPIHQNKNAPFLYKIMIPLFPFFELITPAKVITSVQLAKAILHIVKKGSPEMIIDNKELKNIAMRLS